MEGNRICMNMHICIHWYEVRGAEPNTGTVIQGCKVCSIQEIQSASPTTIPNSEISAAINYSFIKSTPDCTNEKIIPVCMHMETEPTVD